MYIHTYLFQFWKVIYGEIANVGVLRARPDITNALVCPAWFHALIILAAVTFDFNGFV